MLTFWLFFGATRPAPSSNFKWHQFIPKQTCVQFLLPRRSGIRTPPPTSGDSPSGLCYSLLFDLARALGACPSSSPSVLPQSQAVREEGKADQALTAALQDVTAFWRQHRHRGSDQGVPQFLNITSAIRCETRKLVLRACDGDCVGSHFLCSPEFLLARPYSTQTNGIGQDM